MKNKTIMIGIAGPSCAGKTSFLKKLSTHLNKSDITLISLDSYYRDLSSIAIKDRENKNFDVPDAIDKELLFLQMKDLTLGKQIQKPVYNFENHTRSFNTVGIVPGSIIILEGLFTLYWEEIRELLSVKVFINLDRDVCLARRMKRDVLERHGDEEKIIARFERDVWPMFQKYVLPTKKYADICINGDEHFEKSAGIILSFLSQSGAAIK